MSIQCPSYISARSAEVILSDVRPIKLKPDALHSINVLLDETLYSILTTARSLATDRLKAALLKVLPTSLGKEALLEAEVELKAYWDRTGSARPLPSGRNGDSKEFDLQWSFELLRLKCEAYSTMNDSDEDAEAEKRLQQRMEQAGSSSPPSPALLSPAALYLTAILEAICEHVLSNVSRVAARDSSRTLATVQDLFTALGEDDTIFGMFKAMKVYAHIEGLSRAQAQRPRRSKSFSRSTDQKNAAPRTSTSSPLNGESVATNGTTTASAIAPGGSSRMSTDSQKSTTVVGSSESRRTSMEKVKGAKIFHSRTPSDKQHARDDSASAALARSASENGINREHGPEFEASEDEELQQEFDELMRSGATMKVSLTPDRLKSMEVYKQERFERERLSRRGTQSADNIQDGSLPLPEPRPRTTTGRSSIRHVDSIVEDEEEHSSSSNHAAVASPTSLQSNAASASARMRNTSFTATSAGSRPPSDQRLRSISISNVPHPRDKDGITRRVSNSNGTSRAGGRTGSQNAAPPPPSAGMPKRTRKKQVNRESMDLDEIMAGSDGEDVDVEEVRPPASLPASPRTPGGSRPHISKAAQDLIAFLEEGPPEEPSYSSSVNASVISFESTKTRSGRLQRMMSRLTLGGSRESLNGSISEEQPKTPRSLSRKGSKMGMVTSPPPSYKGGSLQSKRSIPNVSVYPNVIVATPPPRLPLQNSQTSSSLASPPVSATSSLHTSNEDVAFSSQHSSLSRRTTRKAVPPLDDVVSLSSTVGESVFEGRPAVNGNRRAQVDDQGKDGTSSPIPPVVRRSVVLNGHPVKLDTSEPSLHPRAASITSPTSTSDRKSIHGKSESGYASRSTSRSPITPSERLPPPPPPAPTIPPADAENLRRLLEAATSADECRLLVDLFLVKNGFALKESVASSPAADTAGLAVGTGKLEDALALAAREAQEVERGLVALFLGGGGQVDLSGAPSLLPSLQNAEPGSGSGPSDAAGSASELGSKSGSGSAGQSNQPEPVAAGFQQQQQQFRASPVAVSH
ncbi:hypothetical protein BD309DRAFT_864596 [Dichomitus squalens]|uniref:Uncharacterized protein n=1 Tax=Dichomitus squalens TaxID=114155 RepID=A0A4Q9NQ64_9APHY|nr:hypothetical protein BD309DRAFT_864596 [Dichomitus squalens]TBU63348.1 hypothetical protein BD310DRAFT_973865 [Dichomitus squalens]